MLPRVPRSTGQGRPAMLVRRGAGEPGCHSPNSSTIANATQYRVSPERTDFPLQHRWHVRGRGSVHKRPPQPKIWDVYRARCRTPAAAPPKLALEICRARFGRPGNSGCFSGWARSTRGILEDWRDCWAGWVVPSARSPLDTGRLACSGEYYSVVAMSANRFLVP